MSAGTLVVKIAANITDFSKGLDAAEKRLMKAGDKLERLGQDLSLKVTAPLLAAGALLAKSAAEDAASVEKMGRVFGKAQGDMESFVQSLMKSVPATDDALRGMVASTGTLLTQMGVAPARAAAMTQAVTKLAGDMAAFSHVSQEVAQDALESALMGKTKGLAQFGIAVSEADVKAKAYQMGLAKTGDELSHTATAQAALAAVLERSQKIQGEAARTIGDNANAAARFKQAMDGVADSFGAVVLPTFVKVANAATNMATGLASLPDGAKSAIVTAAAIAAAWGPLVYMGGNLVKIFTLVRAGTMALVSVQALSGLGSLVVGIRSMAEAMVVARLAGAALITTMAPLLIASAAVAAIGAIGYAIYKSGEQARKAAADLEEYKQKLASFTTAKESQASAKTIAAQLRALTASPVATTGDPMTDAVAAGERERQVSELQARLRAANARTFALSTPDTFAPPPGGGGGDGKNPFADLEERAGRLSRIYDLTNAKGHPLKGLNEQITQVMDGLSAALARQADRWSDVALRIREAQEALQRIGKTSDQAELARMQGLMQNVGSKALPVVGVTSPIANITAANVPVKAPPEMVHLVSIQEAMRDSLVTLPQEFAAQLGNYLGPVLAKLGGGGISSQIGGAVGGAFGNAVGGLIGKTIATKVGGLIGAGIGSTIPVLGTLVGGALGSVAGGLVGKVGSFIGGLFGGKKNNDAAEESAKRLSALADAARKVSEAIVGLPQGIKIAAYRFAATDAGGTTGGGGGGSGVPGADAGSGYSSGGGEVTGRTAHPVNINGPVHVYGVTDVRSFLRELTAAAETEARRGGVTGLQLATR